MSREYVNISVSDECLPELDDVVTRMAGAGLVVEEVFETLGIVSGTIDDERIDDLRQVVGVRAVEHDRAVQATASPDRLRSARTTDKARRFPAHARPYPRPTK